MNFNLVSIKTLLKLRENWGRWNQKSVVGFVTIPLRMRSSFAIRRPSLRTRLSPPSRGRNNKSRYITMTRPEVSRLADVVGKGDNHPTQMAKYRRACSSTVSDYVCYKVSCRCWLRSSLADHRARAALIISILERRSITNYARVRKLSRKPGRALSVGWIAARKNERDSRAPR